MRWDRRDLGSFSAPGPAGAAELERAPGGAGSVISEAPAGFVSLPERLEKKLKSTVFSSQNKGLIEAKAIQYFVKAIRAVTAIFQKHKDGWRQE